MVGFFFFGCWNYTFHRTFVNLLKNSTKVYLFFLGCPSSCKCEEFHEGPEKTILVTGEDLVTVPSNLPSNTGAVYVTIYSFLRVKLPHEKRISINRPVMNTRAVIGFLCGTIRAFVSVDLTRWKLKLVQGGSSNVV